MARCNFGDVATLVLTSFAIALFFYTFNGSRTTTERVLVAPLAPESVPVPVPVPAPAPSRLAFPATPVSATVSAPAQPRIDQHSVNFFQKQAAQRKSMFAAALKEKTPSVATVLLPIVAEAYCPSLVRVGSVADGGKWVCNPWAMPKGGLIFSLGSNNDISFESDFQQATDQAAAIITVDMNAASKEALAGLSGINAKFVHAMIADNTNATAVPPHYTVQDLMKKTGHTHIEILKMDIEGAETTVLPQFLKANSVCQIIVEIHEITEVPKLLRAVANAGFLLQKYELNSFWTGKGLRKYSFIHESCLAKYGATLLASYLKQ